MYTGHGNRGMAFEMAINIVNDLYKGRGIALINKRPTPVKVLKSRGTKITSGYYEEKSTVDYDGVYKGRAIMFEAKSTKRPHFPLSMVTAHQVDYLDRAHRNGAIAFLLVELAVKRRVYYMPYQLLAYYLMRAKKGGRKSVAQEELEQYGYVVERGRGVPFDYLAVVDKINQNS
ncbi:Holliday junction resolvase RecU [Halalkalibacter oceani]|uniref:Holliday junction resolvase RecU n=2 Tax=Halalkalibacter oceani TaxID=1653776 RepID=UPI0035F38F84